MMQDNGVLQRAGRCRRSWWLASYVLATVFFIVVLVLRSAAGSNGVGLLDFLTVSGAGAALGVLPGYLLLRALGEGRGGWMDWLAPSFCASLVVLWVFSLPAYLLEWPLWSAAAWMAAVSLAALAATLARRKREPAPKLEANSFFAGCEPIWPRIAGLTVILVMAAATFQSLQPFSSGADMWYHSGGINSLATSGRFSMADPFHDTSAPHPMYFMNLWYVLLAAIGWAGRSSTVSVMQVLPVPLVPILMSACACLSKALFARARTRLLVLAVFVTYLTFLATSMAGSPDPSMWRQLNVPRWIVLFAVYPVLLALGTGWLLHGNWQQMAGAAALNGAAMFIHPQGGQFYGEVLGFLFLGGLLFRDWRWAGRAFSALATALALIAPVFLLRHLYLHDAIGGGAVSMISVEGASQYSWSEILIGKLRSVEFGRAATLLGSPFFFLGLVAIPLWLNEVKDTPRRKLLLFSLGPAFLLLALPALNLLRVSLHPNLVYRGVWAAPVLAATALTLDRACRTGLRAARWKYVYWAFFLGLLTLLHVYRPHRFEPWWKNDSLKALALLAAAYLALRARPEGRSRWHRLAWYVPVTALIAAFYVGSFKPRYRNDERDFAAQRKSFAIKTLATSGDKGGYVLAGTTLSSHLTALTGKHVLGGTKTAMYTFSWEHREMHVDLIRLLKAEQSLGEFLGLLRARDVRRICIFPDKNRSLAERIEALPSIFPVLANGCGIRLYGVDISKAARREEAEKLLASAREARPEAALVSLQDAAALGVPGIPPSATLASARQELELLKQTSLSELGTGGTDSAALFRASRLYLRDLDLDRARQRAAPKLARKHLDPSQAVIHVTPEPQDDKRDRTGMKRPLPVAWSRTNEACCRFSLKDPRLVASVNIKVKASRPARLPAYVRAVAYLKGRPAMFIRLERVKPGKKSKTRLYRSGPILLSVDALEIRLFSEPAYAMRLQTVELELLSAPLEVQPPAEASP